LIHQGIRIKTRTDRLREAQEKEAKPTTTENGESHTQTQARVHSVSAMGAEHVEPSSHIEPLFNGIC
jgi:hypothetical protein